MACVLTGNTDAHLKNFARRPDGAHAAVDSAKDATRGIRDELHRQIEERWKGTFDSIEDCLSRNRSGGARNGKSPSAA